MKPIGPLMREHRLIERMVSLMEAELHRAKTNTVDAGFIEAATDFFRTYADRTHHGKEEDILFRDLAKKRLQEEHKKIMGELIAEHVFARKTVGSLIKARESYVQGDINSVKEIIVCLEKLIELYPRHIEKEDKRFFYPCLEYFSQQEQDAMLGEFREFDQKMIHERYQKLVEEFEGQRTDSKK